MSCAVLLDTGPLVSFLADESEHSAWVHGQWDRMPPPMLTCEAVLTEAAFILKREGVDPDALFELLQRRDARVPSNQAPSLTGHVQTTCDARSPSRDVTSPASCPP